MPVAGSQDSERATGTIGNLRQNLIPAAFEGSGARVLVTGPLAISLDYFKMTDDYRPIVFAFVLGLSFILLTVVFHSLVVPIKAILMNLLGQRGLWPGRSRLSEGRRGRTARFSAGEGGGSLGAVVPVLGPVRARWITMCFCSAAFARHT